MNLYRDTVAVSIIENFIKIIDIDRVSYIGWMNFNPHKFIVEKHLIEFLSRLIHTFSNINVRKAAQRRSTLRRHCFFSTKQTITHKANLNSKSKR